jgi:hypothetical protein
MELPGVAKILEGDIKFDNCELPPLETDVGQGATHWHLDPPSMKIVHRSSVHTPVRSTHHPNKPVNTFQAAERPAHQPLSLTDAQSQSTRHMTRHVHQSWLWNIYHHYDILLVHGTSACIAELG